MIWLLVQVKGKKKPKYCGTVAPYPDFDPRSDASNLQSSIESRGMIPYFSVIGHLLYLKTFSTGQAFFFFLNQSGVFLKVCLCKKLEYGIKDKREV